MKISTMELTKILSKESIEKFLQATQLDSETAILSIGGIIYKVNKDGDTLDFQPINKVTVNGNSTDKDGVLSLIASDVYALKGNGSELTTDLDGKNLFTIVNVKNPVNNQDVATKVYVDDEIKDVLKQLEGVLDIQPNTVDDIEDLQSIIDPHVGWLIYVNNELSFYVYVGVGAANGWVPFGATINLESYVSKKEVQQEVNQSTLPVSSVAVKNAIDAITGGKTNVTSVNGVTPNTEGKLTLTADNIGAVDKNNITSNYGTSKELVASQYLVNNLSDKVTTNTTNITTLNTEMDSVESDINNLEQSSLNTQSGTFVTANTTEDMAGVVNSIERVNSFDITPANEGSTPLPYQPYIEDNEELELTSCGEQVFNKDGVNFSGGIFNDFAPKKLLYGAIGSNMLTSWDFDAPMYCTFFFRVKEGRPFTFSVNPTYSTKLLALTIVEADSLGIIKGAFTTSRFSNNNITIDNVDNGTAMFGITLKKQDGTDFTDAEELELKNTALVTFDNTVKPYQPYQSETYKVNLATKDLPIKQFTPVTNIFLNKGSMNVTLNVYSKYVDSLITPVEASGSFITGKTTNKRYGIVDSIESANLPQGTPVELTSCGVNLISNNVAGWEQGSVQESLAIGTTYSDTKLSSTTRIRTKELIRVKNPITFSFNDSLFDVFITLFDENQLFLGQFSGWNSTTFTEIRDCEYMGILIRKKDNSTITASDIETVFLQGELGSTATTYQPYQGETYQTKVGAKAVPFKQFDDVTNVFLDKGTMDLHFNAMDRGAGEAIENIDLGSAIAEAKAYTDTKITEVNDKITATNTEVAKKANQSDLNATNSKVTTLENQIPKIKDTWKNGRLGSTQLLRNKIYEVLVKADFPPYNNVEFRTVVNTSGTGYGCMSVLAINTDNILLIQVDDINTIIGNYSGGGLTNYIRYRILMEE